ncbi:MAG: LysM peptidoglycan-binding domain-containing protein [Prevotella sp.]|nr:LysM peptidoglycan-binding domain-containing protein [Prevotella sp.]
MKRILRYFWVSALFFAVAVNVGAQSVRTHKVKKNETIYGIAHANGITEAELRSANPGMERPDYVLKKGTVINIPSPQTGSAGAAAMPSAPMQADDVRQRAIRLGVMLPLNDQNGDGRRMIEYYRGLLMACDSMRREGVSVDVYAWDTPQGSDISATLQKPEAARCDIIVGPLYSSQMEQLSAFCQQHSIMLAIPFSINAPQVATNSHIFQVYQEPQELMQTTARRFVEWFQTANPIIVDCGDPNSTKGPFTSALRQQFDSRGTRYVLTSLSTADGAFASAFSMQKQNVVVLNSARVDDLRIAFVKLKNLQSNNPGLRITIFGYPEWMELAETELANFHRFDMYLPAPYFTNLSSPAYIQMASRYRTYFSQAMQNNMPRFALTGFDQGLFFMKGLHTFGATFDGAAGRLDMQPVQTPLKFERMGAGGYQNRAFMFIHYKTDNQIETLNY